LILNPYVVLGLAILSEVVALTALHYADGFNKPLPILVVVIGYGLSFYGLSIVLKAIPLGITYAIWAGLGTAGMVIVGLLMFREKLDMPAVVGIILIISGVVVLNLFSKGSVA
jgi:small multidrug resistance pump